VPLPLVGVAGFFLLAIFALSRGPHVRTANAVLASGAGCVGLLLLVVQALLGNLCPFCAVVDVSAAALGALAIHRQRLGWDPPRGFLSALAMSVPLAASAIVPFVWGAYLSLRVPPPPPLPAVIAEELSHGPPGQLMIVDFVDFECPFCRVMQGRLAPLLADKPNVHLVRKMVPLTRIHPHALAAAKAACCGDVLGKGEAMADALFETAVEDLTPEGCAHVAETLGLPLDKYRACIDSPDTDARLARDRHEFDQAAVKGDGLPLMWVGTRKIMGVRDSETLVKVLHDALAGAGS
jgi:protein-disulfide isomerase